MTRLFGFVQFEFAGTLAVADGRYVVRDEGIERVLVLETLGAPPPARRRRRRSREAEPGTAPASLPLTRATAVRASEPFGTEEEAVRWLERVSADEEAIDELVAEGIGLLNRALHAHAVASGDPHIQALTPRRAVAVRLGYGSGEEVADGEFSAAREVDTEAGPASRRERRTEELRPQERLAAVLGGRERLDACETLLLRARADLDAGRNREAALQLRVGLEALLVELRSTLSDSGHEEDMATIEGRRQDVGTLANAALKGDLGTEQLQTLEDTQALCERVLRRRRVLGG
ncbi:MAG TPA: hypothetical protein VGN84_06820 [Solirubrobacterales bacterium]|nr:hypothetical protein [Solirubrobacterales bacterium]